MTVFVRKERKAARRGTRFSDWRKSPEVADPPSRFTPRVSATSSVNATLASKWQTKLQIERLCKKKKGRKKNVVSHRNHKAGQRVSRRYCLTWTLSRDANSLEAQALLSLAYPASESFFIPFFRQYTKVTRQGEEIKSRSSRLHLNQGSLASTKLTTGEGGARSRGKGKDRARSSMTFNERGRGADGRGAGGGGGRVETFRVGDGSVARWWFSLGRWGEKGGGGSIDCGSRNCAVTHLRST